MSSWVCVEGHAYQMGCICLRKLFAPVRSLHWTESLLCWDLGDCVKKRGSCSPQGGVLGQLA